MTHRNAGLVVLVIFLCLLAACSTVPRERQVEAKQGDDRIEVFVGGALFTAYKFGADQKYPYFFPVNGPVTGESITTESSEPYPHHHSLFFGCDRVNGGNYWQEGLERGRILSQGPRLKEEGGEQVVIADECAWAIPGEAPIMIDRRIITISAPGKEMRFIDFRVELEPLTAITILKTNHALFSARVIEGLSCKGEGMIVNAEGKEREKGTYGAKSAWCDYAGPRQGVIEGMAILDHPANPWYPCTWFTRDYGFFSPTPMYWLEGDKLELAKGEVLTLNYRVVVHTGDGEAAGIARIFEDYERAAKIE